MYYTCAAIFSRPSITSHACWVSLRTCHILSISIVDMLQRSATQCKALKKHCNTHVLNESFFQNLSHVIDFNCWHTATHCNTLQHTAICCNTLQRAAFLLGPVTCYEYWSLKKMRHKATHCNTLQHTATHCNTPHLFLNLSHAIDVNVSHAATHCNIL